MHTDTPLAGHPTLALVAFGFVAALAPVLALGARMAWGISRDRCGQTH